MLLLKRKIRRKKRTKLEGKGRKRERRSSESGENESLTADEESDDWFLDLKEKIDNDMTPQDFRGAMIEKLFVNF